MTLYIIIITVISITINKDPLNTSRFKYRVWTVIIYGLYGPIANEELHLFQWKMYKFFFLGLMTLLFPRTATAAVVVTRLLCYWTWPNKPSITNIISIYFMIPNIYRFK